MSAYERYRLNVTATQGGSYLGCGVLQFKHTTGGANLLNTGTPSTGTAAASSTYSGYPASAAFTGTIGAQGWLNAGGESGWLSWDTGGTGIDVVGFAMSSGTEPLRAPNTFNLEYSNDNSTWTVATAYSGQASWGSTETRYFTSASVGAHRYWRINVSVCNGGGYIRIGSLILGTSAGDAIITDTSGRKAGIDTSSSYSGYPAINIAQGNPSNYYVSGAGAPQWIDIYLPIATTIAEFDWTVHSGEQDRSPTAFSLLGWNGTGWDTIQTYTASSWVSGETRSFTTVPPAAATIETSEGRVFSVTAGTATSEKISEARVFTVFTFAAQSLSVSEGRAFSVTTGNSAVKVSEGRVFAVVRGRVDNRHLRAFPMRLDGHDFYVLRLGDASSLVYDLTTQQWSEWQSPDLSFWRPQCGFNWVGMSNYFYSYGADSKVVLGDDTNGLIWTLDPTIGVDESSRADLPDDPFNRKVVGGIPQRMRETSKVGAIYLTADIGDPQYTGATITLRTSDDYGKTWTSQGTITADPTNNSQEYVWRSLGLIRAPGRIFEVSDNGATVRIDSMDMR